VVIANGIPSLPVSVQTTAAPIIATVIADNGDFGNACLDGFVGEGSHHQQQRFQPAADTGHRFVLW
jgi:hypothetical protein